MKNCILCDQNKFITTDVGSPNEAELRVNRIEQNLIIKTRKKTYYKYPISFCPLCGEKFDSISE